MVTNSLEVPLAHVAKVPDSIYSAGIQLEGPKMAS